MKLIALALSVALLVLVAVDAHSGGAAARSQTPSAIQSQLGIKLTQQLPSTLSAGQSFQASVVDPVKFRQMGFGTQKPGSPVAITLLDNQGKFRITSGQLTRSFTMDQAGLITSLAR